MHVYWSSDENESRQKEIPVDKRQCAAIANSQTDIAYVTSINTEDHHDKEIILLSNEMLVYILQKNNLNWFLFVGELQIMFANHSPEILQKILHDFGDQIGNTSLSVDDIKK